MRQDTVTDLLAEQTRRQPDATAVVYGTQRLSYAGLMALSQRAAAGLQALGVGAGDRVALWLPNSIAYLALFLGCARLGAIATAVNTRFRSAEVGDIVARSGATVLAKWPGFRHIDFPGLLEACDPAALARLRTVVLYDEGQPAGPLPAGIAHCRAVRYADLVGAAAMTEDRASAGLGCAIFTTSGTTKAPKFVLHAQQGIARHARIVAEHFGYAASTGSLLVVLPFCGVFGFTQLMASLAAGRPMVLLSAFDAATVVELIGEHRIEHLNATDDMIQAMMEVPGGSAALAGAAFIGTAAFGTDFAEFSARAVAAGIRLCGLYGMSEVQALFALRPPALPFAERIVPGGTLVADEAAVRVRDPDSGRLLGPGEAGELEVTGPSLMQGYYGNAEATAEAFTDDGFIRTGDLGVLQDARRFIFQQRMGDVLRLGGFLVSPAEIESHLQRHASVDGAQVVGVQTARGQRAVGFVTLEAGAAFDEAGLQAHCQSGLARFKAPVRIFALPEFPTTKSANGTKIQRARLRQMAAELAAEEIAGA